MIISVINQKGGVGKTTSAVNLAVSLAQWNHPTLLVDLDPQGNATSGVGITSLARPSLYDSLVHHHESTQTGPAEAAAEPNPVEPSALAVPEILEPAVAPGPVPGLSVLGSSPDLAGSEVELSGNPLRDNLRQVLAPLRDRFDIIVIDTPPSLALLTVNALVAADQLIIPVQCEYYALEGLGHLLRTLERVRRSHNPDVHVMGLLRTMYDGRLGLSAQVSAELERHFPQLLFKSVVPRNVRLAEAPSHGQPIALYDRRSPGADAYRRLAVEVLERAGIPLNSEAPRPPKRFGLGS